MEKQTTNIEFDADTTAATVNAACAYAENMVLADGTKPADSSVVSTDNCSGFDNSDSPALDSDKVEANGPQEPLANYIWL